MIRIADVTITRFADLNEVSTADLLAYYNSVTGKNTKQFLKRAKGMQQVWALIEPQLAQVEGAAQEEPAEGAATAEAKAKPAGLKARVDDLLAALASGPRTVAELAEALGMEQKKVRSTIDTARRVGHTIACVGRGTFALPEAAQ